MMLPLESLFGWLNLAGIGVFAASGALAAARQRLDIVGACFFAIVTATGGGGDMTIDSTSITAAQTVTITGFTLTDGNP